MTNKAVKDLAKIWDYTFEIWSERQADNSNLGKNYEGITQNLLGIKVNRHVIFYRTVHKDYIEITRILHERMDLKKRITE